MTIFQVRVEGVRVKAGKLIFDIDVSGVRSAPWTYSRFATGEDVWGFNIHTTDEEQALVLEEILAFVAAHSDLMDAAFEIAKSQRIPDRRREPSTECKQ